MKPATCSTKQSDFVESLMAKWVKRHRSYILKNKEKAFAAKQRNQDEIMDNPELSYEEKHRICYAQMMQRVEYYETIVYELSCDEASKRINRTVNSLRDLTSSEASQLIKFLISEGCKKWDY